MPIKTRLPSSPLNLSTRPMSLRGRQPRRKRSLYFRMFKTTLRSNPALEKCHIRTQLPRRSRNLAVKAASARRGRTPSDQPRTPRAARGRRLLTAPGGSGPRAPAAGRRGRAPKALRPLRPPPGPALQLPPSPSRRRPSPAPLTLHPGCGSRRQPLAGTGRRRKGSPWLPRLRGRVPN